MNEFFKITDFNGVKRLININEIVSIHQIPGNPQFVLVLSAGGDILLNPSEAQKIFNIIGVSLY